MRFWTATLIACALWGYAVWHGRPTPEVDASATPAVSAGPADAGAVSPWRRLLPWTEPEPEPDPIVHCVIGGRAPDEAFLRHSECRARGGHTDEPSWAR